MVAAVVSASFRNLSLSDRVKGRALGTPLKYPRLPLPPCAYLSPTSSFKRAPGNYAELRNAEVVRSDRGQMTFA